MTPEICLIYNDKPIEGDIYRFLLSLVPKEKEERIMRQRVKQNADNMLVGAVLAKYMIAKTFAIPLSAQHIEYGEYGKPYLSGYPNVHFNISHSGQYVVCAVYNRPVGVDIQIISHYRPDVARRVCSNVELLEIERSEDAAAAFVKTWTKKEAHLKMKGIGTGNHLKELEVSDMQTYSYQYDNAIVTLCYV